MVDGLRVVVRVPHAAAALVLRLVAAVEGGVVRRGRAGDDDRQVANRRRRRRGRRGVAFKRVEVGVPASVVAAAPIPALRSGASAHEPAALRSQGLPGPALPLAPPDPLSPHSPWLPTPIPPLTHTTLPRTPPLPPLHMRRTMHAAQHTCPQWLGYCVGEPELHWSLPSASLKPWKPNCRQISSR